MKNVVARWVQAYDKYIRAGRDRRVDIANQACNEMHQAFVDADKTARSHIEALAWSLIDRYMQSEL